MAQPHRLRRTVGAAGVHEMHAQRRPGGETELPLQGAQGGQRPRTVVVTRHQHGQMDGVHSGLLSSSTLIIHA
ncbi:hypothetical protein P376_4214 [Streptomyces sp. HCCB10043]|nr:hypothetical protein P376_4214 [Streptomyces sp. HCCB10043]